LSASSSQEGFISFQVLIFEMASTLDMVNLPTLATPQNDDVKPSTFLSSNEAVLCSERQREKLSIGSAYVTFLLCALVVLRKFSEGDFSACLTFGSGVQCLGFFLLLMKIRSRRSVAGISSKCMEVYALVFIFRLSSTLVKNGYLPVDRSGDWVYQTADIASLMLTLQILFKIHKTHKTTYQAEEDDLNIYRAIPGCMLLALFLHGNLNNSPVFDTLWTIGMNLDTLALVPQLWMLTKIGGEVEGQTSNFCAALTVSRVCSFAFWFYGFAELRPRDGGANVAGWLIIVCHSLQVLLSADFMYYYLSARFSGKKMTLPGCDI